jgi:hypothetical protein
MKEEKIYKDKKLIAEHFKLGWIIYNSCERKWIKSYIKKNKDSIKEYESLKHLVRVNLLHDFICLLKRL